MLDEDWYRIVSDNGDGMPTSPPGLNYCGTVNPIWLNGILYLFLEKKTFKRTFCSSQFQSYLSSETQDNHQHTHVSS